MMDRASGCFATAPIFGQVRLMASRFGSCKAQNKKLASTNINIDTNLEFLLLMCVEFFFARVRIDNRNRVYTTLYFYYTLR